MNGSASPRAPRRKPSTPAQRTVAPEPDHGGTLTAYEAEQVREIAAWKARSPGARARLFDKLGRSAARFAERFIPAHVARDAINAAYHGAERTTTLVDIIRQSGVQHLDELRHHPLEECDRLAHGAGVWAQGLAVAGGAAAGAGGFLTSALDVPMLLTMALRTILKVGHCYGEPLDGTKDRRLVLAILMVAATDEPEKKRAMLGRLREVEDWTIEEAEQGFVEDQAMELLLQVEVFDDIPGLGAVAAGLENLAFIHRVAHASRRVFQERWLRANGKVATIEPAPVEAPARGDRLVSRVLYGGSYYLGYGAMLPVWFVAHALAPADNAAIRGIKQGANAAVEGADRAVDRLQALGSPGAEAPALMQA